VVRLHDKSDHSLSPFLELGWDTGGTTVGTVSSVGCSGCFYIRVARWEEPRGIRNSKK